MKIWKYILDVGIKNVLNLSPNAKVLSVASQAEAPTIWIANDPNSKSLVSRTFVLAPTGGEEPDGVYHGTMQFCGGGLVFHVYEIDIIRALE